MSALLRRQQPLVSLAAFVGVPCRWFSPPWQCVYNPDTATALPKTSFELLRHLARCLSIRSNQNSGESSRKRRTATWLHCKHCSGNWQQICSRSAILPEQGLLTGRTFSTSAVAEVSASPEADGDLASQLSHLQSLTQGAQTTQQARGMEWEVIRFLPDASFKGARVTPESLQLDPRDVALFAERRGYSNQRATLSVRGDAILVRTEIVRGIVRPELAVIFPCRRERETLKVVQAVHATIKTASASLPFELKVLEALLAETVRQFERRHKRLQLLSDSVEREIGSVLGNSMGDLTRLLPIQKKLTEMQQDVRETRQAVTAVLDSDKALASICLTDRQKLGWVDVSQQAPTDEMRQAAMLLESYERQISTVEGALKEMEDYLDVVREVWGMQLDATRNRIIRIELIVAIFGAAVLLPTVPAAWFGMNLPSGYEDTPGVFWPIVYGSTTAAVAAFAGIYTYWRFWPNSRMRRRVTDVRALHDLLVHHIDDLEDVMAALRNSYGPCSERELLHGKTSLGKKEFGDLVHRTIRQRRVQPHEMDLLWRVFDTNRDGFLELGELQHSEDRMRPTNDSAHGRSENSIPLEADS